MRERLNALRERIEQHRIGGPVLRFVTELIEAFRVDRITGLGAEVAFFAFLGLFPLLLVFASVLGFLDTLVGESIAREVEDAVIDFLQSILTDEGAGFITAVENLFNEPAPGLLSIGILLTLWTASRGFAAVTNGLDVVYDYDERRGWLMGRLIGLGMTVVTVVVVALLGAMMIVGPLLGTGQDLAERFELGEAFVTVWTWLRGPLVFVVTVVWATSLYHVAPSSRSLWRHDLPGAIVAALGWILVTIGFRIYVDLTPPDTAAGTVGSVLVAVLWIYAMAIVLLLGGEINAVLLGRRHDVFDHDSATDDGGVRGDEPRAPADAGGVPTRGAEPNGALGAGTDGAIRTVEPGPVEAKTSGTPHEAGSRSGEGGI
ncbi:MAG: YihY/virulence factor BrkB family protein [Acidimicrobiia bacterium]|nr:YihY/virulence factor BrkB family protein [Acidimicrobiia bacterium]